MAPATEKTVQFEPEFGAKWYYHLLSPFSGARRKKIALSRLPISDQVVAAHMTYVSDRNILLVKNSKAGCSTLAQMLYFSQTGKFFQGEIHKENSVLTQGYRNGLDNFERAKSDGRFLFTSVRDPATRAYSAFRNVILDGNNPSAILHADAVRNFGVSPEKPDEYNFDAFLSYVETSLSKDRYRTDRHWRQQVVNIGSDRLNYDLVARLETLSRDMDMLMERLEIPSSGRSEFRRIRFNQSSKSGFRGTAAQRIRIQKIYAADYEEFSY